MALAFQTPRRSFAEDYSAGTGMGKVKETSGEIAAAMI